MSKPCKECKRLREGFKLYVILRNREQFTPPEIFARMLTFTGNPYQDGYLISSYIRDVEIALGIRESALAAGAPDG